MARQDPRRSPRGLRRCAIPGTEVRSRRKQLPRVAASPTQGHGLISWGKTCQAFQGWRRSVPEDGCPQAGGRRYARGAGQRPPGASGKPAPPTRIPHHGLRGVTSGNRAASAANGRLGRRCDFGHRPLPQARKFICRDHYPTMTAARPAVRACGQTAHGTRARSVRCSKASSARRTAPEALK